MPRPWELSAYLEGNFENRVPVGKYYTGVLVSLIFILLKKWIGVDETSNEVKTRGRAQKSFKVVCSGRSYIRCGCVGGRT